MAAGGSNECHVNLPMDRYPPTIPSESNRKHAYGAHCYVDSGLVTGWLGSRYKWYRSVPFVFGLEDFTL